MIQLEVDKACVQTSLGLMLALPPILWETWANNPSFMRLKKFSTQKSCLNNFFYVNILLLHKQITTVYYMIG
jgi:hypothetical protein